MKYKEFFRKFQDSRLYKFYNALVTSATFGIILSMIFFVYESYQNNETQDKIVSRLEHVEGSLSTRYLGVFPEYLGQINNLLSSIRSSNDSIIIFEDVLYYGIKSSSSEFVGYNSNLFRLANRGNKIIIAYYNSAPGEAQVFRRMIKDAIISPVYINEMQNELRDSLMLLRRSSMHERLRLDSLMSEKYFQKTLALSDQEFYINRQRIIDYLTPTDLTEYANSPDVIDQHIYQMCNQLDSIKRHYLGKENVTFADYENMYSSFNACMVSHYSKYITIELLPINEYLTMGCWHVKSHRGESQSIFAFPSKYSSDEIGFISHDKAFAKYISEMLHGMKSNIRKHQ